MAVSWLLCIVVAFAAAVAVAAAETLVADTPFVSARSRRREQFARGWQPS